jgi:hypothetical protein
MMRVPLEIVVLTAGVSFLASFQHATPHEIYQEITGLTTSWNEADLRAVKREPRLVDGLKLAIGDANDDVRLIAINLATDRKASSLQRLIAPHVYDEDGSVASAAVDYMVAVHPRGVHQLLRSLVLTGRTSTGTKAAMTLAKLGDHKDGPLIANELVPTKSYVLQEGYLRALDTLADRECLPILERYQRWLRYYLKNNLSRINDSRNDGGDRSRLLKHATELILNIKKQRAVRRIKR